MSKILNIGHRGAMAYRPENTMSSFELAIEQGADMFELDAKLTLDGVVVVMHDNKVNRTTNGRGRISQMTAAELKELTIRETEKIPTLEGVLDRFGDRCEINIELKAKDVGIPSYELVMKKQLVQKVVFSSFDGMELARVKNRDDKARLAFLCEDRKLNMVSIAERLGAEVLSPKHKLTKPELVKKAHAAGLKVNVWTVNSPKKMQKFIDMGVDGIITNKPDVLNTVLTEHQ